MRAPAGVARAVDEVLELSFAGSDTRIGIRSRRALEGWVPPARLDGKVVMITGGTAGIGLAAARGMAMLGASTVLLGRDPERGERAVESIRPITSDGATVEFARLDLADIRAVASYAERFAADRPRLDVLVNNAGTLPRTFQTAPDGTELTLATHLVGVFALTEGLLPLLEASAPARVITVTSSGMYLQRMELGSLETTRSHYRGPIAYARAKRAQVALTAEWGRRHDPQVVSFHAAHPGWVDTGALTEGLPTFARLWKPLLRTAEEGADTLVWLAGAPTALVGTGRLWHDRRARRRRRFPVPGHEDRDADLYDWLELRTGLPTPTPADDVP